MDNGSDVLAVGQVYVLQRCDSRTKVRPRNNMSEEKEATVSYKVEYRILDPVPPPTEFIIRNTEGQGSWKITEADARQLYERLGEKLKELDKTRASSSEGGLWRT